MAAPGKYVVERFEDIPTYREREMRSKKAGAGKKYKFHIPKSRTARARSRRVAVRDSKRAYRAIVIQAQPLSTFRSQVKESYNPPAACARHPKTQLEIQADEDDDAFHWHDVEERNEEAEGEDGEERSVDDVHSDGDDDRPVGAVTVIDLTSDYDEDASQSTAPIAAPVDLTEDSDDEGTKPQWSAAVWPANVRRIWHTIHENGIVLPDLGSVDWCGCQSRCHADVCQNALTDTFCSSNNCKLGLSCGNRREDAPGLELKSGPLGFGLFAKRFIAQGSAIGEYSGILTDHDHDNETRQSQYVMSLSTRSTKRKKLFIDSETRGGYTRFINHSCNPNTGFFEVGNRRRVAVMVYALQLIVPGSEITASYGDQLWFKCQCGAVSCVSKSKSDTSDEKASEDEERASSDESM